MSLNSIILKYQIIKFKKKNWNIIIIIIRLNTYTYTEIIFSYFDLIFLGCAWFYVLPPRGFNLVYCAGLPSKALRNFCLNLGLLHSKAMEPRAVVVLMNKREARVVIRKQNNMRN